MSGLLILKKPGTVPEFFRSKPSAAVRRATEFPFRNIDAMQSGAIAEKWRESIKDLLSMRRLADRGVECDGFE